MDDNEATVDATHGFLNTTVSRAQLLAAAGAGLAMLTLPTAAGAASAGGTGRAQQLSFSFFPQVQGTYTPEDILNILNVLETAEMFLVTYNTYSLTAANLNLAEPALSTAQAMLAIGQYHIDFLESLGAHSLLTTFTPRGKPSSNKLIGQREGDAALLTGAYMTAVREFAELGQPMLAKNAAQAGATWGEMRSVARALSVAAGGPSVVPAPNKAFETDHFLYVRDLYKFYVAGTQFENKGASVSGLRLTYQGRDAVLAAAGPMASGVIQKPPNNAVVSTSGTMVQLRGNDALTGERGDSS